MSVRFDKKTIVLHWLVVMLLSLVWAVAQVIDAFPKGGARINVRSIHMALGLILGAVMCYRLWWRLQCREQFQRRGQDGFANVARLVHWLLYGLILLEVLLGVFNAWGRGDVIFNLLKIAELSSGDRVLRKQIEQVHALGANIILVIIGCHAAAGLFHHFVVRDDVLQRMLPSRKRGE